MAARAPKKIHRTTERIYTMTTATQIILILCGTFAVLAVCDTFDKIFGKKNKDKGDKQ